MAKPPLGPSTRGATIVEFALVLPILICLLLGVLGYGQYFLLAHSVQQIANDAARATVAGLDKDEREALAKQSVSDDVSALREFADSRVATQVDEDGDAVAVEVTLDAHGLPPFNTPIVPMPAPLIERRAVVRRGGLT
ncbi:TadE/TadG family type IV pilus assembly protein [Hephaestia mangrovi]|uniref:TadE/TadG family type IV pilus assembly protein n=1 Tax=Hephaestia mangrovi TaxID=2873268 RepID=UPI001CA7867E|nr:TadE/TadG family type IV pilus assembly protein [Hephaestia mangrovi]MBY8829591.1 pilus assembly protein [Hephaestia mangrovi]